MIDIDTLNDKTIQKIDKLKEYFHDKFKEYSDINNDWTILRFLKAWNFDLIKTQKMLKNHFIYLDQIKMWNIAKIKHDRYESMKYFGDYFKHEDKNGYLLAYWKLGNT